MLELCVEFVHHIKPRSTSWKPFNRHSKNIIYFACNPQQNITPKIDKIHQNICKKRLASVVIIVVSFSENENFRQNIQKSIECLMKFLADNQRFVSRFEFLCRQQNMEIVIPLSATQWKILTRIILERNSITSEEVIKLCTLDLKYLKHLNLQNNCICDEGIIALSRVPFRNLFYLNVSENPIQNKGIKALCKTNWPNISFIRVKGTRATSHILSYLQKMASKPPMLQLALHTLSNKDITYIPKLNITKMLLSVTHHSSNYYYFVQMIATSNCNTVAKSYQCQELIRNACRGIVRINADTAARIVARVFYKVSNILLKISEQVFEYDSEDYEYENQESSEIDNGDSQTGIVDRRVSRY